MVVNQQVDWRQPQQALALDLSLVETVFRKVHRQYDQESAAKLARRHGMAGTHVNFYTDDQHPGSDDFASRRVAKADILIGLKETECYLEKRPFLRALYTNLACCSNEKEMESISNYVKCRLRERSITFSHVRELLEQIYQKHIDLMEFESRIEEFKTATRAKSTWCVHDKRSICSSPSRFYGIHKIPTKPKTAQEQEKEAGIRHEHAVAVVSAVVDFVVTQIAATALSHIPTKVYHRDSQDSNELLSTVKSVRGISKSALKKQEHLQVRRSELRLRVLLPGINETHKRSNFGAIVATTRPDVTAIEEVTNKDHLRQHELLALMEANGDLDVAQRLIQEKIPLSGFRRVSEHLANLPSEDSSAWSVIKLWKTVYRNHTIQSVQRLEQAYSYSS